MELLVKSLRTIAALVMFALALLLLVASVAIPFLLREDAANNRTLMSQFERASAFAAAFETAHRRWPQSDELRRWAWQEGFGPMASDMTIDASGCADEGFGTRAGDRFVLSVWRGEFADCYAFPSGRTTLMTSVPAFLFSRTGLYLLTYLAAGLALFWVGARIYPFRPIRWI